ncbi:hypothetical protein ACH9DO_06545 [Kocuria sp. M1N1S27]|uniref:hypothetical protein n=1 Tax=Kocuria kalidii TaxID=3376283 RepID=UPI0037A6EF9B
MEQDWIGLYIGGPDKNIDARALADGAAALVRLLEKSSQALKPRGSRAPTPHWVVERLATGSLDIALAPEASTAEMGAEVVRAVTAGIAVLDTEPRLPEGWNRGMLLDVQKLGKIAEHSGVEGVSLKGPKLGQIALEHAVLRNVDIILNRNLTAIGAVTGQVISWHVARGEDRLEVRDEATGENVDIRITDPTVADVGQIIRKRIRVRGYVRRNLDGTKIDVEATGIDVLPKRSQVSIKDIRGILGPDWADGDDPVTWQRRQRDIG